MFDNNHLQKISLKSYKSKKTLGQNFLINQYIVRDIIQASGDLKNQNIIEIGAGPCILTHEILKAKPKKFYVIEYDKQFTQLYQDLKKKYDNFTFFITDVLKFSLSNLPEIKAGEKIKIISNLPYNIATKLICHWLLSELKYISEMILMIQDEVAIRLTASNNSHLKKSYGSLSVITELLCNRYKLFEVGPQNFVPAPKVNSAVINLIPKSNSIVNNNLPAHELLKICKRFFAYRRKTILNILKQLKISEENIEYLLREAKIDVGLRPENLPAIKFYKIASIIKELGVKL